MRGGPRNRLGSLEAAVMDIVWASQEPLTVRSVVTALQPQHPVAYTTVLTVMDNLHRKGVLDREPAGRAFAYRVRTSREEFTAELIDAALSGNPDPAGALIHFTDRLDEEQARRLAEALANRANPDGAAPGSARRGPAGWAEGRRAGPEARGAAGREGGTS